MASAVSWAADLLGEEGEGREEGEGSEDLDLGRAAVARLGNVGDLKLANVQLLGPQACNRAKTYVSVHRECPECAHYREYPQ